MDEIELGRLLIYLYPMLSCSVTPSSLIHGDSSGTNMP